MLYKYLCVILTYCFVWFFNIERILTKKPNNKRQQEIWRLECELGVVADIDCPVDGGWAPWAPWSPCRGPCDSIGHRRKVRECINPLPSRDGFPCSGPEEQIESCFLTNCTVEDYRKLVNGDFGRIQALRQLEAVPSLLERCLVMECPFEAIEAALATDNTWQLNSEALWNSLQCVKHNIGCPVVGEWGAWGSWSACGARCGTGNRWRLRRCDTPSPSEARFICTGSPLELKQCSGDECANDRKSSGGSWGNWEQWTACSEQCGVGVRRRKRHCLETHTLPASGVWGTHCKGQHDQLEECESKHCKINGGWSGWSLWGPCSQTCGVGKQSRTRSCTRPIPSGNGTPCVGFKTEIGSCYLIPCHVQSHTVALFSGDSLLQYNFENRRSTFFHFYVRFMTISPHGIFVRRINTVHGSFIRLSLQKWHICLDTNGFSKSCSAPRICSQSIVEPAVWHSILITVTNEAMTLRLDDEPITMKSTFTCDPELLDDDINISIGEKLHGEIQELILNFIPMQLTIEKHRIIKNYFSPSVASNIAYDKAGLEEAYLQIVYGQYIRLPCFTNQDEWHIELTLKSRKQSGTILFLKHNAEGWLLLSMQNMRLRLKLKLSDFYSESITSLEYLPNLWLDINVAKQRNTNAIEVVINFGERLHVLLGPSSVRKNINYREREKHANKTLETSVQSHILKTDLNKSTYISMCTGEYFIGGVPFEVKRNVAEDFLPFSGIIATLSINGIVQDLYKLNVERYNDDEIQVSSRTASISGSYQEISWGKSNHLNLTCLHDRYTRSLYKAYWLFLDTAVRENLKEKNIRSVDNGKLLRLVATANNGLRGFYTCRAYVNGQTRNVVTYGVLGRVQYKLSGPDMTTMIAVITTLALVIGTLVWLLIEGIHDIREGHGFFRDSHLSPLEEAEAICKYIDQNNNLLSNKQSAEIAKTKARKRGHKLASRSSFAAQEPQGLMEENLAANQDSTSTESENLPALPEARKTSDEVIHNIFRYEPNYISSPRHGSITSPRTKISSSSSFELTSPRVLCSRLLMTKHLLSSKANKKSMGSNSSSRKAGSTLPTIKSSSFVNQTPARKILQKFQQLKSGDED